MASSQPSIPLPLVKLIKTAPAMPSHHPLHLTDIGAKVVVHIFSNCLSSGIISFNRFLIYLCKCLQKEKKRRSPDISVITSIMINYNNNKNKIIIMVWALIKRYPTQIKALHYKYKNTKFLRLCEVNGNARLDDIHRRRCRWDRYTVIGLEQRHDNGWKGKLL